MADVPTTYEGPVCNLTPKANVVQPQAPSLPQIPVATDLASALQAIRALTNIVNNLIGQQQPDNNLTLIQNFNGGGGGGGNGSKTKLTDFSEVPGTRITQTVRIFNPDDSSQWVDVEQITGLTFKNKTGQTLVYQN